MYTKFGKYQTKTVVENAVQTGKMLIDLATETSLHLVNHDFS